MSRTQRNRQVLIALIGLFVILGCRSCYTPQMEFDKVAEPSVFTGPGEVITYSYTLKNISEAVFAFSITDDKLGAVPCEVSELGAGDAVTCQITYTTTEEDVAAGVIQNTASATGMFEPRGGITFDETVMTDSAEVVYESPQCQLDMTKSASPTTYTTAGQVIEYTYQIHNVGYAYVSGPFAVIDNRVDEWSCDDGGAAFDLCVDCYITCRGSYTIKESDVGSNIVNTARVQGVCNVNDLAVASNTATATVYYLGATPTSQAAIQPELTATETVNQEVYSRAGEVIVYTYKVQNTGHADVQGPFTVVDNLVDQWECDAEDVLPVGGQVTCKGYYQVRGVGADITNAAHVEGVYLGNTVASNNVSATVYYVYDDVGGGPSEGGPSGGDAPANDPPKPVCEPAWSPGCQ